MSKSAKATVSLEEAVKALDSDASAPNPFEVSPGKETTTQRKKRLDNAHRFETARERAEEAEKRSVGIVGRYGRVNATVDGFLALLPQLAKNPTYSFKDLVKMAEDAYRTHNPDKKISANSARLYAQEITQTLQLLGLVVFNPKAGSYSTTPQFLSILQARK
jgi:hypothetical protein